MALPEGGAETFIIAYDAFISIMADINKCRLN